MSHCFVGLPTPHYVQRPPATSVWHALPPGGSRKCCRGRSLDRGIPRWLGLAAGASAAWHRGATGHHRRWSRRIGGITPPRGRVRLRASQSVPRRPRQAVRAPRAARAPALVLALAVIVAAAGLGGDAAGGAAIAVSAAAGAFLGRRTAAGRALTGPVCAMAAGVAVAQALAVAPGTLRRLQQLVVGLATPLLLLSCNLEEVLGRRTRRLLAAFSLGSLGSFLGGLLGVALLQDPLTAALGGWPEAAALASALTAKNIGSGLNFLAVVEALHVPAALVATALTVDNIIGLLYFPLASGLMPTCPSPPTADEEAEDSSASSARAADLGGGVGAAWRDAVLTLLVASAIALTSRAVAPAGLVHVASTVLAVLAATAGARAGRPCPSGDGLGQPLLYLYFASAGFAAGRLSPGAMLASVPLLQFGLVLYATHLAVVFVGGRLCRLDRSELLVASNANVGGPATASSMALAKGFSDLARPSLLVGMLGNAIGTALGLGLHCIFRAF